MNKVFLIFLISFYFLGNLNAQFGYRSLKKEQSSASFVPVKFKTLNDSVLNGYGYLNSVALQSIVFSKEKPTGKKTKDWKVLKVKNVELYRKVPVNEIQRILTQIDLFDSITAKKIHSRGEFQVDTLRAYYLRNMKGNVGKGFNELVYENNSVRLFEAIETPNFVKHELVFFQTKELPPYDSDTYFLNYHNQKAFLRSAKRVFKECPKILEKINRGAYFPKNLKKLKQLAYDYEVFCKAN
ncbi:hypothetical protein MTsPCn9_05600 [Croceitalea sp. MTPC9]|uniref:hypothetical protein n=1 Tax=unclassified Croceitalea TaxID=2632280 RepID=UPI002B3F3A56|nr:hypothetical protein MTsPCn6_03110 [Croceitalea sp. MTPC6]GMN15624.1 hypothetical protein MTsPCn9_05600 [Croceitalea sp. MTPC9]